MSGYGIGDDREAKAAARNRDVGRRFSDSIIAEKDAKIEELKTKLVETEKYVERRMDEAQVKLSRMEIEREELQK